MRAWTPEMKQAASDRMKALWADPNVRQAKSLAARTPGVCPDCGESDASKFYLDKRGNRSNSRCKECHKLVCAARWHAKSRVEKQATRVSSMYGLSPAEYLEMYERQEGKCAICKEPPTTARGLHVDHCHSTHRVRGLLCHGCNTAIGALKDDPEVLRSAIQYLGG